jgi:hypothetical protein
MIKLIFVIFSVLLHAYKDDGNYSIKPYSVISDTKSIDEGSAILKSKKYDIFWTLNDSGDVARIFAIDLNGKLIKPDWVKKYSGLKITDAYNSDWEALTYDSNGDIIICDCGNNYNYRRDLALYRISEPNPYYANEAGIISKYPFSYPDQKDFPPDKENFNYDAEAIFSYKGKLHIITKTMSTSVAKIYRFNSLTPWQMNVPEVIVSFDFKSLVTDAAVSEDGKYISVLTYNYIWLFATNGKDNPFDSKYYFKEISLGQCEGVSFLKDEVIISNENGYLFKIKIGELKK